MNILISTLVNPDFNNGLGKYIKYLINSLQEIDSNHHFFIIVNLELSNKIDIYNHKFKKIVVDIPHHPRVFMRPVYFFWQHSFFKSLLKKNMIDVFHSPNPVPIFSTFGTPYVVTIHDVAEYSIQRFSPFRQKLRIWATESSAKLSKEIITVSKYSQSEIVKKLNRESKNVHITYPGLTLNPEFDDKIEFSKPYFLHVGGSRPNKNVRALISAFRGIKKKDIELYIVGNTQGIMVDQREKKKLEKEGIYLKGLVSNEELVTYYKNAIALVYPSLYEGFGLPILEAMACGIPVITSNCTSMPEVGGEAVHYVDPYSIESIRVGMEKILTDEDYRQDLIRKGLKRYKKFSWEEAARKTIEVYEMAKRGSFP